jgi:hypothetical protein
MIAFNMTCASSVGLGKDKMQEIGVEDLESFGSHGWSSFVRSEDLGVVFWRNNVRE